MLRPVTAPLPATAELLVRGLGVSHTMAGWLARQGHSDVALTERFLNPRLADLTLPDAMADRAVVAGRLAQAIRARERVAVFGDYDCDGITSAVILTEVIRALGGDAVPLIASRFDGGYGVSAPAVERIIQTGAGLLVTCDCGSSDHDNLARVRARGVEVVVIDHHLVPDRPLPALGFLNPHRPECGFAYKGLASCGLALSVAAALRKELGANLDLRYWLDLVAVGTVADVAPLTQDNRALVRAGLEAISKARRPGMAALLEIAKIDRDAPLTGRDIAFRIAPHINAPGRIGSPSLALELLIARDVATARTLAAQLDQVSAQRRALSDEMLLDASAQIEAEGWHRQPAIVVGKRGWNPGVVGIVAGRLVDRFGCPVIVVGFEGESGRGSVRGPVGSRLYDALAGVGDILERFGGHQQAAGLEVAVDRMPELRRRFAAAIEEQRVGAPSALPAKGAELCALEPQDDPAAVLSDLGKLEPCGFGNPRPRLLVKGRVAGAREVKNGHLKLLLELPAGRTLGCFAISQGSRAGKLEGAVTVIGDLRHNSFPGADPVELFAEEVSPVATLMASVSTEDSDLRSPAPVAV